MLTAARRFGRTAPIRILSRGSPAHRSWWTDVLYVPLSSLEESGAGNPNYPCCTFRGALIAYDAVSGKRLWKSYTIPEQPVALKKTSKGTQLWGPAGAGVWSSPAIDVKNRVAYVATGNGYTEPAAKGSDAVIAFDPHRKRLWTSQVMANDSYVRDCPGILTERAY